MKMHQQSCTGAQSLPNFKRAERRDIVDLPWELCSVPMKISFMEFARFCVLLDLLRGSPLLESRVCD